VEKNSTIAANWLSMAARKQHAGAQAILGELLWRGQGVRQRPARGLALLTLANENAKASGHEPAWIGQLYQEAFAHADNTTRKDAEALLPQLGGARRAATTTANMTPKDQAVPSSKRAAVTPAVPSLSAAEPQLGPVDVVPPAAMGMSVGFGASSDSAGGF